MIEFLDPILILGIVVAFISAIIHGYAGFGGGIVIVPILAILFGPVEAIAITSIAALAGNIFLVPDSLKIANWQEVAPASIATAVAAPLGLLFLISADPEIIRKGMGIFVLAAVALLVSGWTYPGSRNTFTSMIFGALSGGVTGGFGIPGGPFIIFYYMSASDSAIVKRANIIITICVGIFFILGGLIFNDVYTPTTLFRTSLIVPAFILGTIVGRHLFNLAELNWYKKVIYAILTITGITALLA